MKKLAIALICLMLAACILSGALATGLDFKVPSLGDMLIIHRVFQVNVTENYSEYYVLFYGESSRELWQINDEIHFKKSSGCTYDMVADYDIDEVIPGFSRMSFASSEVVEGDDYFALILHFKNLRESENLHQMEACGFLTNVPDSGPADADYLAGNMLSEGIVELSTSEYDDLGLSFRLDY